jgi:hypothetical protein
MKTIWWKKGEKEEKLDEKQEMEKEKMVKMKMICKDGLWGPPKPPIQWIPGALSPGVKRQGREADHSPPTSAEVKKMWIYISTPPYAFMA